MHVCVDESHVNLTGFALCYAFCGKMRATGEKYRVRSKFREHLAYILLYTKSEESVSFATFPAKIRADVRDTERVKIPGFIWSCTSYR